MSGKALIPGTRPERTHKLNRGSFQKGRAKTGGRAKGVPNRITGNRIAGAAVADVYEGLRKAGADGKGKDGVVGFVMKLAIDHPERAALLLLALLPKQLKLETRSTHIEEQRTVLDLRAELITKGVPESIVRRLEAPPPIDDEYTGEYAVADDGDDDRAE